MLGQGRIDSDKFPYTGLIYHNPKGSKKEIIAGEWLYGYIRLLTEINLVILLSYPAYWL